MTTIQQEKFFNEIDNLWIKEINRRRLEIEKGDVSLVNGEEVFKKIQQKFS